MTSLKGIGLRKEVYLDSMAEAGPLCKRAEDLELLTRIMAGSFLKTSLNTSVNLKDLNIFYQESSGDLRASKLSSAAHNALMKAARYLEQVTGSTTKVNLNCQSSQSRVHKLLILFFSDKITRDRV